jgi:hypothetical protein
MAFDRTTVIMGPAIVTYRSYTYYTQGNITVESTRETWEPKTSIYGALSRRASSSPQTKISFTPVGALEQPTKYITMYTPASVGTTLFSGTDYPLVIQTLAGKQITWQSAAVTKPPDLILSAMKTGWGAMEFMAIGKKATDLTDPSVQASISSLAFSDTSFDSSKVASAPYSAALGALGAPFNDIMSEDGFTISNNITTEPRRLDSYGIVNWMITECMASVRFVPANCDDADLWELFQLQGSNAILPGADVSNLNQDLVITGGVTPTAVSCTLTNVGPDKTASRYGLNELRAGEVEMFCRKTITSGSGGGPQPQLTLTFS